MVNIKFTDPIIKLKDPAYLYNTSCILEYTPKRIIANYMIWRAIYASLDYVGGEIRNYYLEFKSKTTIEPYPERWKECVKLLSDKKSGLTVGLSAMYVRKHFNNKTRKSVEHVVYSILEEFEETVKNVIHISYKYTCVEEIIITFFS